MRTKIILSVDVQDTPGALGRLARHLAEAGVNMDSFSVDKGTVRFMTDQTQAASQVLQAQGYNPRPMMVFEVHLENRPGTLARLAAALGDAGISIATSFGVSAAGRSSVYVSVDDEVRARPILKAMDGVMIAL